MWGLGRGYSSANRSSAPAHSDPLGYSGISPTAGQVLQKIIICTPTRRGPTFVRTKVGKIRLGLCPKTPVAGCAGYGLIFDGSPKSIRTAHRIAPKVAAAHLPFPPTPFPDGGKGARMGGRNQGNSLTLGVLGLAKAASRWPMVMVSGAGGLHRKGGRSPPPEAGEVGRGQMRLRHLISTV